MLLGLNWIKYQAKILARGDVSEMTNFVPSNITTQSINQSINQPLCLLSIFNSYKYYISVQATRFDGVFLLVAAFCCIGVICNYCTIIEEGQA